MTDIEQILELLLETRRDLEDHKVATRNMLRVGKVVERDKDKGVRLETGTDDEPHRTAWGNPAERSGVERDVPRMGAQCMFLAPYGDQEQGIVHNFGHSDEAPNPASDVDETVLFNRGKIRLSIDKSGKVFTLKNDKTTTSWEGAKISHTVDGNTTTFEKDTITLADGSKVHHGAKNIGKDHVHGGVKSGSDKTADPEA